MRYAFDVSVGDRDGGHALIPARGTGDELGFRLTGTATERCRIASIHPQHRSRAHTVLAERDRAMLDTSVPSTLTCTDELLVRVVSIAPAELATIADRLPARRPPSSGRPSFASSPPRDGHHHRFRDDTVDRVEYDLLSSRALLSQPLIRHEAARTLATAMLLAFPNPVLDAWLDPYARPAPSGRPGAVHRAIAYIDDRAGEPIGIGDVAAAARTVVGDLHTLFRRHRDITH